MRFAVVGVKITPSAHVFADKIGTASNDRMRLFMFTSNNLLALMTNSHFVGCSSGRSAGFVSFRILST